MKLWFLLGGMLMMAFLACSHPPAGGGSGAQTPESRPPTGSTSNAPAREAVVVLKSGSRTTRVSVEVVRTPEDRARGLMYRRSLSEQHGMLFVFDQEDVQSFWMKNTYIPLDMLFIDGKMRVVGVVENAEPLTETSRSVGAPSLYVLEVNGGFARQHGVGKGTEVVLDGVR